MKTEPDTITTSHSRLEIERLPLKFESNERRVITRPFVIGGEGRFRSVCSRVKALKEKKVEQLLAEVLKDFSGRHEHDLKQVFEEQYRTNSALHHVREDLSEARRLLIGSYFTMEYSIEAAALFNPSIVPHPDQSDLPEGALRFVMSLRATGEGHISSIVFRTGVIHNHEVILDPSGEFSNMARQSPDRRYDRTVFRRKLIEMGVAAKAVTVVMDRLPEQFSFAQLEETITHGCKDEPEVQEAGQAKQSMMWLARSNYRVRLPDYADVSELVIFPQTEAESRGIEDLRLVQFQHDDGSQTYYGTYTAYNGYTILPQMLETSDFHHIDIHTLNGAKVQNKGMALFPRKIDGHYVMCSRIDGENLFIMYSDYPHFWESAEMLIQPKHPWEIMQIGNCGSPIETEEGWILITHGVGPMRKYCLGAMLLDRDNPLKVLGHLDEPLLMPSESEREGYVPNVVYSCGALKHQNRLYIPYAMSDSASSFASVDVDHLLERLTP